MDSCERAYLNARIRRAATVVVGVVALVAAYLGPDAGNAGISKAAQSAPDWIAVALTRAGGGVGSGGLVIIDPSGRRVATLTRQRAGREDSEPAWSPDGTRLAFTRTSDGRRSFQIYVVRADGTGARRLTSGRFDTSPAWSPDGHWIAYRSNGVLRIVQPDGHRGHAIPTYIPTYVTYPEWAPGGRIAYSYWDVIPADWPAACRLASSACGYVVTSRLDGGLRRRVVRGRDGHWSPDGRTIVYTGPDGGVYTASGTGAGGRFLGRGYLAEWSHDGKRIVYARMGNRPSDDSVWVMNRDGGSPHRIIRGASDPSWRP